MERWLIRYGGVSCLGVLVAAVALFGWVVPRLMWMSDARALVRPGEPRLEAALWPYAVPIPPPGASWSYRLGEFTHRSASYMACWSVHTSVAGDGECRLAFTAYAVGSRGLSMISILGVGFSFSPAVPAKVTGVEEAETLAKEVGVPVAARMERSGSGPGWWQWHRPVSGGATAMVTSDGKVAM